MLIDLGADVNARDSFNSETPALAAAVVGNISVVNTLVHGGANVTWKHTVTGRSLPHEVGYEARLILRGGLSAAIHTTGAC